MEFDHSEEQLVLQDTLQRFIARDYDFDKRRAILRSDLGFSADAWRQYAELGLLSLPLPEEFGGLGGNAVDVMVVMEQFGHGLLMEPYLSSVVLCGTSPSATRIIIWAASATCCSPSSAIHWGRRSLFIYGGGSGSAQ